MTYHFFKLKLFYVFLIPQMSKTSIAIKFFLIVIIVATLFVQVVLGQSSINSISDNFYYKIEHFLISSNKLPLEFNSFGKPYSAKLLEQYLISLDTTKNSYIIDEIDKRNLSQLINEIHAERKNATVELDKQTNKNSRCIFQPLANYLNYSNSNFKNNYNQYGVGLKLFASFKNNLSFLISSKYNEIDLLETEKTMLATINSMQGEGYYNLKKNGAAFFDVRINLDCTIYKYIHLSAGQDKFFLGDGLRSLYLSNNSGAMPYFKINFQYKKFNFSSLFLHLSQQINFRNDNFESKKYAALHYLSYNLTSKFQVGLFESIIFSRNYGFEIAYLNPMMFYRAVEQSQGSPDNANMGFFAKCHLGNHSQIYSQFYLDDFNLSVFKSEKKYWGEKYAFQIGMKRTNLFGIKHFDIQIESNVIRPFVYSHKNSDGNCVSFNSPITHPLGANFKEVVGKVIYQPFYKLTFILEAGVCAQGIDSMKTYDGKLSDWGSNPLYSYRLRSYSKHDAYSIGDGVAAHKTFFHFNFSYQIASNIYFDLKYFHRTTSTNISVINLKENYFGVGFRINTDYSSLRY